MGDGVDFVIKARETCQETLAVVMPENLKNLNQIGAVQDLPFFRKRYSRLLPLRILAPTRPASVLTSFIRSLGNRRSRWHKHVRTLRSLLRNTGFQWDASYRHISGRLPLTEIIVHAPGSRSIKCVPCSGHRTIDNYACLLRFLESRAERSPRQRDRQAGIDNPRLLSGLSIMDCRFTVVD